MESRAERADALARAARAAATCTDCDLHARATQTVFGRGPVGAPITLVGEQPSDREDLEGEPFVGPAGRLLDRALGATAAKALLGSSLKVTGPRGRIVDWPYEPLATATIHPSAVLRAGAGREGDVRGVGARPARGRAAIAG